MFKQLTIVAIGGLVLVGCGPGAKISGKDGAAQALFAAASPTKAKLDSTASPVDLTGGLSWNCPHGGTASITGASISVGGGNVGLGSTLTYNGCGLAKGDVGVAVFNGSMTFSQQVTTNAQGASVAQTLKGKVQVQGAYDDFLDADIVQTVAVGDVASSGRNVAIKLKGTIKTSEGTFTFDEEVTITSGSIKATITNKM